MLGQVIKFNGEFMNVVGFSYSKSGNKLICVKGKNKVYIPFK